MVSRNKLALSPVIRSKDSGFKSLVKTSSVMETSKQCENRLSLASRRAQYPYIHRCVKPGLGSPSGKHDSQWQLDKSRKNITYQCSRVKGSDSGLKKLSKHNSKPKNSDSNRQRHCGQLPEQTGDTHSWDMCLLVWRILAYCNPRNILIRARHIQGCSQTSNLCITSPRCKCTEHRCIEHLLGGSGWLCLLSCSSHSKSHSENEHLQVQNDCSGPRVAHDALVLGPSESINQTSITVS